MFRKLNITLSILSKHLIYSAKGVHRDTTFVLAHFTTFACAFLTVIFSNCLTIVYASFDGKKNRKEKKERKKEVNPVVFSLISIYKHFWPCGKNVLPPKITLE